MSVVSGRKSPIGRHDIEMFKALRITEDPWILVLPGNDRKNLVDAGKINEWCHENDVSTPLIIFGPVEEIAALDEETMGRYGWVRAK